MRRLLLFIKSHKSYVPLIVVLLIAIIAHSYNMFGYPYYENDEGVYMSQAWSVLRQGKLAPYTYWYDHAPLGWFFISLWVQITGGFFTFGTSVNSGRFFMLVLHVAISILIFYITKKLTKRNTAGLIAILIFSLSPLGIYFQRRVLLDNIMVFWVLVSWAFLMRKNIKLSEIVASAFSFGFAVLTKENAVFFAPAFIYILATKTHKHNKAFANASWFAVVGFTISIYFLYALLKNEFFPVGFLGSTQEHVSLITTLQSQISRGTGLPFYDTRSEFYGNLMQWLIKDKYIMYIGFLTFAISLLLSIKVKYFRVPTLFTLLFLLFLIRGGLVIDFYIIPLLALFSLGSGLTIDYVVSYLSKRNENRYYIFSLVAFSAIVVLYLNSTKVHFVKDETSQQISSLNWIKDNLETDDFIVIDNSIYVDLHEPGYQNDKVFYNAEWFWKVEEDNDVRIDKLEDNWRNIDYISLSHEMIKQMRLFEDEFIKNAFINSIKIEEWSENSSSFISIEQLISTNGDWARMYKVQDDNQIILSQSWNYYKNNFIKSYGQVVDPSNQTTTSEGQSYALLKAVWMDDKNTFDGVWNWTRDHLRYRQNDRLLSWKWGFQNGNETVLDPETASDADQDTALALAFAFREWNDFQHYIAAAEMIHDIWETEVIDIKGRYYLVANTNAKRGNGYLINPSYISPAHYKIFSEIDSSHDWLKLRDDSYTFLNEITQNGSKLPPNWVYVTDAGTYYSADSFVNEASVYGYDAFRTFWRVYLDAHWYEDQRARNFLLAYSDFWKSEIERGGTKALYSIDKTPLADYTNLSTNTAALSSLLVSDADFGSLYFKTSFEDSFNYDEGFWGESDNYYDQNWAWFSSALYNNSIKNLWVEGEFVPQNKRN